LVGGNKKDFDIKIHIKIAPTYSKGRSTEFIPTLIRDQVICNDQMMQQYFIWSGRLNNSDRIYTGREVSDRFIRGLVL